MNELTLPSDIYNIHHEMRDDSKEVKILLIKEDKLDFAAKANLPTMIYLINNIPYMTVWRGKNADYNGDIVKAELYGERKIGRNGELLNDSPKNRAAIISDKVINRDISVGEELESANEDIKEILIETFEGAMRTPERLQYLEEIEIGESDPKLTGTEEKALEGLRADGDTPSRFALGVIEMNLRPKLYSIADAKGGNEDVVSKINITNKNIENIKSSKEFFEKHANELFNSLAQITDSNTDSIDYDLTINKNISNSLEIGFRVISTFYKNIYKKDITNNETEGFAEVSDIKEINKYGDKIFSYYDGENKYTIRFDFKYKINEDIEISEELIKNDLNEINVMIENHNQALSNYATNFANLPDEEKYPELWDESEDTVIKFASDNSDKLVLKNSSGLTPSAFAVTKGKTDLFKKLFELDNQSSWQGVGESTSILHLIIESKNFSLLTFLNSKDSESFKHNCKFESQNLGTPLYMYLNSISDNEGSLVSEGSEIKEEAKVLFDNSDVLKGLGSDSSLSLIYKKKLMQYALMFVDEFSDMKINSDEDTILHVAASNWDASEISKIFDKVDPLKLNTLNAKGLNPIMSCIYSNEESVAIEFLSSKYRDSAKNNLSKTIVECIKMKKFKLVKELVSIEEKVIKEVENGKKILCHIIEGTEDAFGLSFVEKSIGTIKNEENISDLFVSAVGTKKINTAKKLIETNNKVIYNNGKFPSTEEMLNLLIKNFEINTAIELSKKILKNKENMTRAISYFNNNKEESVKPFIHFLVKELLAISDYKIASQERIRKTVLNAVVEAGDYSSLKEVIRNNKGSFNEDEVITTLKIALERSPDGEDPSSSENIHIKIMTEIMKEYKSFIKDDFKQALNKKYGEKSEGFLKNILS